MAAADALSRAPPYKDRALGSSGCCFANINAILTTSIDYQQLASDQTASEEILNY